MIPNGYHKKRRKKRKERPAARVYHDDPEVAVQFLQCPSDSDSDLDITHFTKRKYLVQMIACMLLDSKVG